MQRRRGDNYVGAMAFSLVDSFFAAAEESDLAPFFRNTLTMAKPIPRVPTVMMAVFTLI